MQRYLRQGELDFSVGYKLQTRWGWAEAAIFTLECAGAALFAAALLWNGGTAVLLGGLAMVALAVGLLLAHLGNPQRAWRAVLNVRTSWISRGTIVLGGFLACGALYFAVRLGAGGATGAGIARFLEWILLLAGAFVLLYPGLVLSSSPAIPFWNSALLPVFSAFSGAASGLGLFLAAGGPVAWAQFWVLAALAIVTALYLAVMGRRGGAAAESAALLLRGDAALFLGAGCGLGVALPVALTFGIATGDGGAALAVLAAASRVAGDLATRQAFLKVGMFSPVA